MATSPARAAIDVGSVIAETYRIEAVLGRGGMGSVYLASHLRLPGKQVAIKLLHADVASDEVLARFRREAEIASRLGHPNIVAVHDFKITPDGTPYLVLEYLRGETLAQRLHRGPLPVDQIASIVRQVGSALAAAHRQGVVHRDLKPHNIFLVPTEVDGRIVEIAKVLDFGISKLRGSHTVKTQDSVLLGTPQYMAPEQAKGDHARVDERTDVFALGAIIYEMLSGAPAFAGETIPEVVFKVVYEAPAPLATRAPEVPATIVSAVERAMTKAPGERFATVSELVEAVTGQPIASYHPGSIPPPDAGFAAGSKRVELGDATVDLVGGARSSPDAFARTVGPGEPSPPRPADQPTVPARPPVRPRRRPIVAIMVGAIAIAGLATLTVYLVKQPASEPALPPEQATGTSSEPPAGSPSVLVDAAVAPPDAAIAIAVDAAEAAPADASVERVRTPAEPDVDLASSAAGRQLLRALSALHARDHDTAQRLANAVFNTERDPRLVAQARAIRGAVHCAARRDEERARIELRAIPPRYRGARVLLLGTCRRSGITLGQ
jgi:eukaryotic-like serine/threonine-protein kinase